MHRAAHSSSQVLGGGPPGLITPQCETLWCALCGRSAGRSDSCALREPPSLAWPDNWQLRGIPCGPISSRVCEPHLMTLPVFAGVRVLGVDERCVASPGPTSTGPRELTGIVDYSRGGSSHGPLEWTWSRVGLAPCMRTGWPSAANSFAPVSRSRRWIPSRDRKNASVRPSRQMRRISVSMSPSFTGQVREVFHQAIPAQGQRLAARLIQRLPACPIPEIARLGQTLRKWKDALDAYFDTGGASNGSTEAINGHYRAGQTHRQRLPQPHQLPTPNAPHRRRSRCLHPHSTLKSRLMHLLVLGAF